MNDYLIVVDVQNDFCPGGNLAVEDGDRIIPNINRLMNSGKFDRIIATQDWHPEGHISFASTHGKEVFESIDVDYGPQVLWPVHCVMNTPGAEFRPSLDQSNIQFIVRKGYRQNVDSYSGFLENDKVTETGLAGLLPYDNIKRDIYICGIATDVCVYNTAIDAIDEYGKVFVVVDASAGVAEEGVNDALDNMRKFGIQIVTTEQVLSR